MIERTRKNYDGQEPTGKVLSRILPTALQEISAQADKRPELVLAAWPELIGPKFSSMATVIEFFEGQLFVKVTNSSLYALLQQHEKPRLLNALRKKFPKTEIRNIVFRMG
ncbi:MAG: DUF721 domain-containing protein [Chlamydiota bacterium]